MTRKPDSYKAFDVGATRAQAGIINVLKTWATTKASCLRMVTEARGGRAKLLWVYVYSRLHAQTENLGSSLR